MKFYHLRNASITGTSNLGGATFAVKISGNNRGWKIGVAVCDDNDNFNKKIGRSIAAGRLSNRQYLTIKHQAGNRFMDDTNVTFKYGDIGRSGLSDAQYATFSDALYRLYL